MAATATVPIRDDRVDAAETAKLIRRALAGAYSTKFSVRTRRSGGGHATVDVTWADGPTDAAVHGNLLHVVCARCFTAVAPIHAVAAEEGRQS